MATIKPFRALRPAEKFANRVASVPYDVVSTEEAKLFAEGNSLSFIHVTRSEIDLEKNIDPYSPMVYQKAKEENLQRLTSQVPLVIDRTRHYLSLPINNGWKGPGWNCSNIFNR